MVWNGNLPKLVTFSVNLFITITRFWLGNSDVISLENNFMKNLTKIQLAVFSFAIPLFSCKVAEKHHDDFHLIDTSGLQELVGREISTIDSSCYYDGMVIDSTLLLIDGCNDYFLYGFEPGQFGPIVETGLTGQGPGDFISMPFFSRSNEESKLTVWDPSGFLKEAEITRADLTFSESKHLSIEFRGAKTVAKSGNRVYASKHRSSKGVVLYHQEGEDGVHWIVPPDYIKAHLDNFVSGEELTQPLADNNFEVGEADQFLAVGMKYYNSLFFINNEGQVLKSFLIAGQQGQDNLIVPKAAPEDEFLPEESSVFVYDSYATDRFLYFLSYGGSSLYNFQNHYDYGNPHLLIFDREMNYVEGFSLDRMLGFICVSADDKRLFGGALESDGITTMVEYELGL